MSVAVMPGADAVLVPELSVALLVPQAASNPTREMIAIPLILKALSLITLFNRTSFPYAGRAVSATTYLVWDRPNPPPPSFHPPACVPSERGRLRESSIGRPGCRAAPQASQSQGWRHKWPAADCWRWSSERSSCSPCHLSA